MIDDGIESLPPSDVPEKHAANVFSAAHVDGRLVPNFVVEEDDLLAPNSGDEGGRFVSAMIEQEV